MATFKINIEARGDFLHSEPALAYGTLVHNEQSAAITMDIYQKIPYEDLTINLVSQANYGTPSAKKPLPISNVNSLGFIKFELESLEFKSLDDYTDDINSYDLKFICTSDGLGNYAPLQFGVEYPVSVIKRGLFISANGYLPLSRAYIGNVNLKYNFRYPDQTAVNINNNPFKLIIQFGSTIKDHLPDGDLSLDLKQIRNIKPSQVSGYIVPVLGEYNDNGNNIPTHYKAGISSSATSSTDGLNFTIINPTNAPIVATRQAVAGNTSGTPTADYMPMVLQSYTSNQLGVTKLFSLYGSFESDFLSNFTPITAYIYKYITVMSETSYEPITY